MAAQALFDSSDPASRVYPYLTTSAHAAALRDCIYRPGLDSNNICTHGLAGAGPGRPKARADGRSGRGPRDGLQRLDGPALRPS